MIKLGALKKVKTYEELESLGIGQVECNISSRGGGVGFCASDVAQAFEVSLEALPRKFGAGCNYLGGGVRGSIFPSTFNNSIIGKKARLLKALACACVRVYENLENGTGLNNEEYPDGEINWDAQATKGSRKAGIVLAY